MFNLPPMNCSTCFSGDGGKIDYFIHATMNFGLKSVQVKLPLHLSGYLPQCLRDLDEPRHNASSNLGAFQMNVHEEYVKPFYYYAPANQLN
jgi:hypothetical protein